MHRSCSMTVYIYQSLVLRSFKMIILVSIAVLLWLYIINYISVCRFGWAFVLISFVYDDCLHYLYICLRNNIPVQPYYIMYFLYPTRLHFLVCGTSPRPNNHTNEMTQSLIYVLSFCLYESRSAHLFCFPPILHLFILIKYYIL